MGKSVTDFLLPAAIVAAPFALPALAGAGAAAGAGGAAGAGMLGSDVIASLGGATGALGAAGGMPLAAAPAAEGLLGIGAGAESLTTPLALGPGNAMGLSAAETIGNVGGALAGESMSWIEQLMSEGLDFKDAFKLAQMTGGGEQQQQQQPPPMPGPMPQRPPMRSNMYNIASGSSPTQVPVNPTNRSYPYSPYANMNYFGRPI